MSRTPDPPRFSVPTPRNREELEQMLLEGLESGEPQPMTPADWEALREHARQVARRARNK